MSKKIDKDALVAEIKRRIVDNTFGAKLELMDILAWLDSLPDEPASEDLEEEFELQFDSLPQEILDKQSDGGIEFYDKLYAFSRHFAEWGAEHLRKPTKMMDEDLEEEVKNYFQGYWPGTDTPEQCNTDLHFTPPAILRLARHFAEWQKEQDDKETAELLTIAHLQGADQMKQQMMKGAVKGKLVDLGSGYQVQFDSELLDTFNIKYGQKFKVIVIPED